MPLPMVHLNVAVGFIGKLGIKTEKDTFFLGNIAPDSIHMRDGSTREDKNKTHFSPGVDGNYLARLGPLYSSYINQSSDTKWRWFVRGYFMHLLTDYYWFQELHPKFVESNELLNRTPEEIRTLYYKETDQIDFNLYKHKMWSSEVWELLAESRSFSFGELLTSEEVIQWRDRTFLFFNDPSKEPGIIPEYITDKIVADFVEETIGRLKLQFEEWECGLIDEASNIS
ncbi:zinc dependent phospholipase C family protein [Paenibacillus sp. IHBB 10380]|uniref:zinc dependent phospholipase C family protein n=1 Tax=Paenibacillus sp. IHBB 10380 TaxID=1566358 RepID=UPI0005CFBC27|nr:zinc dependent phospholipase C family protein [Paenibacillus sp. IHBB 10380]AJS58863.1 hypothetical protein UB51_10680 [Paenibacillus sp. IHBB 10380]